ncbi:MAG: glycosyltransferase family 2 protein [Tolypothrix carrinoi HA7290-LM1]|jgi:glycosyltransferase involved in cell wall biosynthesis|nr:glycosyltransferase family 2 protein [Tolypothrix carrinoi HA7290-LM1]
MNQLLSIIICTHNPRRNYLDRVLQALEAQTLPKNLWELVLVDNASDKVLSSEIDLSWHPNARHIREDQLGLTPARLRGIREAQAEILVFVDDDNVLDSDYLELALRISKDYSVIGTWGGQTIPEFEVTPPDWMKTYWGYLAVRKFEEDKWSNLIHQYETTPYGAGMCVRKIVADKYVDLVYNDPKRLGLDRKGNQLMSCGDIDLAYTACDIGLGIGIFTALRLKHLIPANRTSEEYLVRMIEGSTYSNLILDSLRGKKPTFQDPLWKRKLSDYYRLWNMHPKERPFFKAMRRAQALAIQEIQNS